MGNTQQSTKSSQRSKEKQNSNIQNSNIRSYLYSLGMSAPVVATIIYMFKTNIHSDLVKHVIEQAKQVRSYKTKYKDLLQEKANLLEENKDLLQEKEDQYNDYNKIYKKLKTKLAQLDKKIFVCDECGHFEYDPTIPKAFCGDCGARVEKLP